MEEILEQLKGCSIQQLQQVIAQAQQLIGEKEQQAQRQAQLERERLERERMEQERRRQEEIAQLQERLRQLQGEQTPPPPPPAPTQQQPQPVYSMISCPHCHQLVPSDSRFCTACGGPLGGTPGYTHRKAEGTKQQPTQQSTQNMVAQPTPNGTQVEHLDGTMTKWDVWTGEYDVFGWRDVKMIAPEEAKKQACYLKITARRILFSTESLLKARARTTAFGALGNMLVEEKGKPWVSIPLPAVRSCVLTGKKEMRIQADQDYVFTTSKAKDIYEALQKLIGQQGN